VKKVKLVNQDFKVLVVSTVLKETLVMKDRVVLKDNLATAVSLELLVNPVKLEHVEIKVLPVNLVKTAKTVSMGKLD